MTPMGITSENVASLYNIKRAQQDSFAASSHAKATVAQRSGRFNYEMVPHSARDNGVRPDTSRIQHLRPVFSPEGTTTAGNSSQISDGSACVCVVSRSFALSRSLPILATVASFGLAGVPPTIMGVGPVYAIPKALSLAGVEMGDVDMYEINEAFASQACHCVDELGIEPSKVNVNGGAIALGHPLGCTGARLVVTLVSELGRRGGGTGVVSMCIGTGMGMACVLRVSPRGEGKGGVGGRRSKL